MVVFQAATDAALWTVSMLLTGGCDTTDVETFFYQDYEFLRDIRDHSKSMLVQRGRGVCQKRTILIKLEDFPIEKAKKGEGVKNLIYMGKYTF